MKTKTHANPASTQTRLPQPKILASCGSGHKCRAGYPLVGRLNPAQTKLSILECNHEKTIVVIETYCCSLFIFLFVFLIGLTIYTKFWEQQQCERLAEGSVFIETDQRVIEYAEVGSGPVILALHGSPGGYSIGENGAFWAQAGFRYISFLRPRHLRTPHSSENL